MRQGEERWLAAACSAPRRGLGLLLCVFWLLPARFAEQCK